jgi:hypothetical protein
MNKFPSAMILAATLLACGLSGIATAQDYDQTFLSDYSKLQAYPMQKYDIMGAAVQGEITDSASQEVLAQFVGLRGNTGQRIEFDKLNADIKSFASRLRCRLDNTHVPAAQQIDCLDPAARAAREAKGPVAQR